MVQTDLKISKPSRELEVQTDLTSIDLDKLLNSNVEVLPEPFG